ncbi:hypothetical protein SAMN04487900_10214 [Prevotella communis]|uniref:Uncharacterized protein n=1 Tax=Prevotella communis TaxID=2913614 RepID=A0A1H0DDH0_9BACT|nr:hypothetical protein SAMN04487900_10214 [Prevotella communis]
MYISIISQASKKIAAAKVQNLIEINENSMKKT